MAAVIEDRDIGLARRAGKPDGRVLHAGIVEIETDDGLEAAALEWYWLQSKLRRFNRR
jgi:hypothetical protein